MPSTQHEQLIHRLQGRHQQRGPNGKLRWLFIPNLRVETGFGKSWAHSPQTLDAWAMDTWPGGGYQMITYEVKVSRADFLSETRKPGKRQSGLGLSTHFYFVVPAGMVEPDEIPEETGLIYMHPNISRVVRKAPKREYPLANWDFLASAARALQHHD